ncbi:MAG: metallophosphoesterase [Acetatifactor sp.]
MKTAVISDIHIDINKDYDVLGGIVEYIRENSVEMLLIAGDISNCVESTIKAVCMLEQESGVRVLYVPGNHDMWDERAAYESNDRIYEKYLADEHCLSGKTFETKEHFLIGDIGWYDYSFGNHEKFTEDDFKKMTINGRVVQDSLFNTWSRDNEGRCRWFVERLEAALKKNPGKKVLLMTHMLSHEAFLVSESRENWSYLNGFLGSRALKKLCVENNIEYAVCGHVHYRKSVKEGGTTWLCRCLNYHNEWRGEKDVRQQIATAMEIIEL